MSVAIIDYGSGNLRSVAKAFERVTKRQVQITRIPDTLTTARYIVLPGVGAFADCMAGLKALPGMLTMLHEQVIKRGKPFLGICVGMQMLFERGYEHGVHEGLGWLEGEVVPFEADTGLKIPHMGWNELHINGEQPLLADIKNGDHAYFVHSYLAKCKSRADVLAWTEYGQKVPAVVGRDNIMGTQFHPEKSQATGLQLIKNFLGM